jgi:transposase
METLKCAKICSRPPVAWVQHKTHFQQYYSRKLNEGKPHRVIMNNIINKIIRMTCSIWNQKTGYDPKFLLD